MEAVILAGGKGSRLLPHTAETPKPMVPIGGKPIIEILLARFHMAGVKKVYLAVNHLAEQIESHLGDGSGLGLEIVYSKEAKPLSTVGPIRLIKGLPEAFIVANGDVLTDLNVKDLFDYHLERKAELTVATCLREDRVDYGVLETDPDNTVTRFTEKPPYSFRVSMGIYVFSRSILELVPEGEPYGFDQLVLELLRREGRLISYPYTGYWQDIGRPEDYARVQEDVRTVKGLID